MAKTRPAPLLLAALILSASCGADPIDGLGFSGLEGASAALYRPRAKEPTLLEAGEAASFALARAIAAPGATDLLARVSGSGALELSAFASGKGGRALASATFELAAGVVTELRLPLPAGSSLGSVTMVAREGARLSGLGLKPAFKGVSFDGTVLTIDSTSGVELDRNGGSILRIRLSAPVEMGSSLVLRLAADGVAVVRSLPQGGGRRAYEAKLRRDRALALPYSALGEPQAVEIEARAGLASASFEAGDGFPLSDLYAALEAPPPAGDYSAFRWDALPSTIILDFKDYGAQDRYLKRLAFFAEKPGFRGRLAGDAEIAGLHGWNAHDYSASMLARFFSKAAAEGFPLSTEESALRDALAERGLIIRDGLGFLAGEGALISVSRESGDQLRRLFADHEASHALLFQDPRYEALAAELWRSLDAEDEWFWKTHFEWREYDVSDGFLCLNELQAYLVQQPVRAVYGYYENLAARLGKAYPAKKARLEDGTARFASTASRLAGILSQYLETEHGLAAGAFGRARPIGSELY